VQSAKQAFADRGYHETSISLIVREAGIARSTFYQYFDSKLHLFQSILDSFLQDLHDSIRPISLAVGAPAPLIQLQDNLTRVLNLVLGERDLTRILLHHTGALDRTAVVRLEEFYGEAAGMIQRSLNLGIAMNLVRPCDTRLTSYSIIGAVKEVVFQLTSSCEPQPSMEELVRQLLEFAMGGILVHSQTSLLGTARRARELGSMSNPARPTS
jgi:AcrR family transcriptional regulator